jgi:type II secretory pathway pseudopilin PulG
MKSIAISPVPVNGQIRMSLSPIANERGATLMVVLVMIVVLGLGAGMAGTTWKTVVQKSKEEELLFRGDQYRRAIESYLRTGHPGIAAQYPAELKDLVRDPRSPGTVRHIRRLYSDPMTGGDWELIRDQGGRITGVRSASGERPFRQDGFPKGYESFRGAARYSDWDFVARVKPQGSQPPQEK